MDTCASNFHLDSLYHAKYLSQVMMNLRDDQLVCPENSVAIDPHVPEALTRGAVYMISVILIYVLLAITGSAITASEYLLDSCVRKAKPVEKHIGIYRRSSKCGMSKQSSDRSFKTENSVIKAWLKLFKQFLQCFCFLNNVRRLLVTSSCKDQFECLNGIRFLNNVMIILLHICLGYILSIRNTKDLKPLMEIWPSQLVMNGQYAVDAFFILGGFLNAYLFFINYERSNGNVSWFYFYLKRFIRLTPVYMVVLGILTFLFPDTGNGPAWAHLKACRQNWWLNLLYINNFKEYTKQCMAWCWYLAADMQFYIISPIFLISLFRNPRLGYILTGICIAASCYSSFIITKEQNLVDGLSRIEYHIDDLNLFLDRYWTYFNVIYIKPYTRISSYLVAFLLAHYLYKKKSTDIKCSRVTLFLGWLVTGVLWFIAYFALFHRQESIIENAVYNGIKHLIYSIGLSWIIFVCLTGQGGIVNRCLSWKVFYPLSKLSYCAYLIHPIIIMAYFQTAVEDPSFYNAVLLLAYTYFWTYVFSFITSLLFEIPVLNLLEMISEKYQTRKQNKVLSKDATI